MKNDKKSKSDKKRFNKIIDFIVEKGSPVSKGDPITVEDEADAGLVQHGTDHKIKRTDLNSNNFR